MTYYKHPDISNIIYEITSWSQPNPKSIEWDDEQTGCYLIGTSRASEVTLKHQLFTVHIVNGLVTRLGFLNNDYYLVFYIKGFYTLLYLTLHKGPTGSIF